jgi:hypothetical protein
MNKTLRRLVPVLLVAVLTLTMSLQLIQPANASPGGTYQSTPTNHATDITVTDATKAYDGNIGSYALFNYYRNTGHFEVTEFTTSPEPWGIVSVDFKLRYKTTLSSADAQFRILYYVDPSGTETVLQEWIRAAKSLYNYSWSGQPEPIDGTWSWTDVSNVRLRVETNDPRGGDSSGEFYWYEAWLVVNCIGPTLYVDPTDQSVGAPFTVDINITDIDDLYSWEWNVTYDTAVLTATDVTELPFLNNSGSTQFNKTINDAEGWVYAYCTLIGDIAGVTGSGDLATISFSIDDTGTSSLDLHNSSLIGYDFVTKQNYTYPDPYYCKEVDGTVTTTAVPEFPLGAAMEIALASIIIYVWWTRRGKTKPQNVTSIP